MQKVSIIVPVYNTSKYLKKCLDSIINQTYKSIEVIIVNDGSTDNSESIINEYKNNYPDKIKCFSIENSGVAFVRNFAIDKVSGEYFIFVDSDDFIDVKLLDSLSEFMKQKIEVIKYKLQIINSTTTPINGPVFNACSGEDGFNKLCFTDILIDTPCLYLFKTSFYKENKFSFLEGSYHEDLGLIPLIILKAKTFISTDVLGYNYVQVANSIMRNEDYFKTLKRANDLFLHYDKMLISIEKYEISQETKDNLKLYFTNCTLRRIKELKKSDRKQYREEIKKRELVKNIKVKNIKQLIKKIIYTIFLFN